MRAVYIYIVVILVGFQADAISQDQDSLKLKFAPIQRYLDAALSSKAKTDSLWRYHFKNWIAYNDEEGEYYETLIQEKIESSQSYQSEYYWRISLGRYKTLRSNIGEAAFLMQSAVELADKMNDPVMANIPLGHLGYLYFENGLYDLGVKTGFERIKRARESGDSTLIRDVYSSVGWQFTSNGYVNGDQDIQDTALVYLKYRFETTPVDGTSAYGESSIIYCMALARTNNRKEAIRIGVDAVENVFSPNSSYHRRFLGQLSQFYTALDMKDSALFYINQMLENESDFYIGKEEPNIFYFRSGMVSRPGIVTQLVGVYNHFGDYQAAARIIDQVKQLDTVKIHPNVMAQYDYYGSIVFWELGQYKKAYESQKDYLGYVDSMNGLSNQELQDAGTGYAQAQISMEQKRSKEAELQQKLLAAKDEENKQVVYTAFGIGSAGLIVFLFLLYKRYRKSQGQKAIIEQQKAVVELKQHEIIDSIQYAKRIQKAILPPEKEVIKHLPKSFILYKPKDIVAGDFYWMHTSKDELFIAAADCTGHGVPGAMVSVVCNNGLNRSVREFGLTEPGKILDKSREIVVEEFAKSEDEVKDGMDIALISIKGNLIKYAGAHNSLWIIRKDGSEIEELKADKQPIGAFQEPHPFHTQETTVNPGDRIYLFTDGYSDQFGGDKGKKYKAKNFKQLLLTTTSPSMNEQKEKIDSAFESWRGNLEQLDDVCVIGIEF